MSQPAPRKEVSALVIAGCGLLMVLLPPFVYYMWICLVDNDGALIVPASAGEALRLLGRMPAPTLPAAAIFLGWFAFQALLQRFVPGPTREGAPLADGSRLKYTMNGWASWWLTWAILATGVTLGFISPTLLADQLGPLLTVANIFAFGLSLYLYFFGRARPRGESISGNVVYDYFMGTSLNPRIGRFDWKLFCEARPGLIGWIAIDLSLAAKQYQLHGAVSTPMLLVIAFQFLYVADYFFHEEAILSTWDIKHERFGWMLCWGDLVWVPFTYTIQALYLVYHPHDLPLWATIGIVALNLSGYYLFRSANIQKHRFRKNPDAPIWGKKPEYISTARGTPLLVSGWWGVARHMNYMGDLMMGLAWCLPCLFKHVLPYFYVIYFTILLLHRERRDSAACAEKYGDDWAVYCRRVRSRIVPGLY